MSVKNEKFDGSVIIGRDLTLGGGVVTKGSSTFEKNLRVEGWLDAPNLRGACKGLFATEEKLNDMYPNPEDGMWAMVGETIPAYVYMAENGEWVDTGNLTDGIDINLNDTEIVVNLDEVKGDISALETAVDDLREEQQRADNQIKADLNTETNLRINKDTELKNAIDNIDGFVKIEVPDLTAKDWGLVEESEQANNIVNAIISAKSSHKGIILMDTYRIVPISMFTDEDPTLWLTYTTFDADYNEIQFVKSIERGGFVFAEQEGPTTMSSAIFSHVVNVPSSVINATSVTSGNIVYNSATKTFVIEVSPTGIGSPSYYNNGTNLAKYGTFTQYGYKPYSNVFYSTGSAMYLWDGDNMNLILQA